MDGRVSNVSRVFCPRLGINEEHALFAKSIWWARGKASDCLSVAHSIARLKIEFSLILFSHIWRIFNENL